MKWKLACLTVGISVTNLLHADGVIECARMELQSINTDTKVITCEFTTPKTTVSTKTQKTPPVDMTTKNISTQAPRKERVIYVDLIPAHTLNATGK